MDSVVQNVVDLSVDERQAYERMFGQPLQDNQKIVVQLVDAEEGKVAWPAACAGDALEPYAMWAQFSDEEVAELESAVLDRSESRTT